MWWWWSAISSNVLTPSSFIAPGSDHDIPGIKKSTCYKILTVPWSNTPIILRRDSIKRKKVMIENQKL